MTKVAHLRRRRQKETADRIRATWKALVAYANADLQGGTILRTADRAVGLLTPPFTDEFAFTELLNEKSAAAHQGEVRKLLTWLCTHGQTPTRFDYDQYAADYAKTSLRLLGKDQTPVEFLDMHAHGVKWELDDLVDEPDHPDSPYFCRVERYDSLLSPICAFLAGQIPESKSEDIPVRICERVGCDRFMLPERSGRKHYCEGRCRALQYQHSRPRGEWNAYMRKRRVKDREHQIDSWLKELLKMKPSQLCRELGKQPSRLKNRLDKAERRFRGNKEIQMQISAVYKRASK